MDISSGFGRCDCNGWSCLSGAWNIFLYLTLFLLLTLGGDLLMSCSRAAPQRGFLSSLHSCFELKQPPSFSSAFCPSCSLPAAVLGVCWERAAWAEFRRSPAVCYSNQTNNQFLSSLGSLPRWHFFLLGTALSQGFRNSAAEILLVGSSVQNTGFKNQC